MPACRILMSVLAATLWSLWIAGPASAIDREEANPTSPVDRSAFAAQAEGFGPALEPAALETCRGGDDSVANDVRIRGLVEGNSAQDIVSGNNTLGGDAFSNASGIATVIQNSGANVLIQNGMVVNVQFAGSGP